MDFKDSRTENMIAKYKSLDATGDTGELAPPDDYDEKVTETIVEKIDISSFPLSDKTNSPYEFLSKEEYDSAFGSFAVCEGKWRGLSEETYHVFIKALSVVTPHVEQAINKAAKDTLDAGHVLSIPIGFIRLTTNADKCPKCGGSILDFGALSRYDNKTRICSECGVAEALENHYGCVE